MSSGLRRLWLFALALPAPAVTQDSSPLDLSGTIRFRYETITNQPRAGFNRTDDLASIRTTLLAKYDAGPALLVAELWDSRAYGSNRGTPVTTGEVNALEMVQLYATRAIALGDHASATIQAGRFMLNLGSRRLVAADDYRNTTNGYTGVHADFAAHGATASLIYVLPQQRRPDDLTSLRHNHVVIDHEGFDRVPSGGTIARPKAIGPVMIEATYSHFGEHDMPGRPTRNRSLDTYGGRLLRDHAKGKVDGEVEALYQSGSIAASAAPTAVRLPVSAWFVHAESGYTLAAGWQPRLSIQYDRASGDKAGGHYGHFDTLFGMRRADIAPGGLYNAVARANVSSPGAKIEITPSKRVDAFASYHALWLAEPTDAFSTSGVKDASGKAGSFAGHQFDARMRWWMRPGKLRLEMDGVVLTKGRFLREAPNAPAGGTTLYTSLNLTAMF